MRKFASLVVLAALLSGHVAAAQQRDPRNPTCPPNPNWSPYREMRFTPQTVNGNQVLLAEGFIDDGVVARLRAALDANPNVGEIWFRSPGGNARVGNEAGRIIREAGMLTRIPAGWACFSACNFMFMGGMARFVDQGGLFIVHMFTHTSDRAALDRALQRDAGAAVGQIEQQSAQLAAEDNMFLIRMGVRPSLLTDIMYQVSAVRQEMRCLTQQEVLHYNVATAPWTGPAPATGGTPGQPAAGGQQNQQPAQRSTTEEPK